jgi:alpha-D-xyloside xylohydrolase
MKLQRAVLVAFVWLVGRSAYAQPATRLESSRLVLEVTAQPYGYRVLERSTSALLVGQSTTTFTFPGVAPPPPDAGAPDADAGAPPSPPPPLVATALAASNVVTTATTLDADLALSGEAGTAHVRFTFTSPEVLEVHLTAAPAVPPTRIREEMNDQDGEHHYGVFEYPFGKNLYNKGVEQNFLGLGQRDGSLYTSGRAPFYVSSRKYGIYAQSPAQGRYTIAVAGKTSFAFDARELRYHVIYGPGYYDVLARYTAIAGAPLMPPLWGLDSIWWQDDFNQDLRGAANAQASVVDLATQLQNHRIPASGLLVDRPFGTGNQGWGNMDFDPVGFPDPPQMVADLRARGLNLILWVANRAWNDLYTQGTALGYLFPASQTLGPAVDMRNPAAYAWFRDKLDAAFVTLGAKGYKIDRGEQGEHPDAVQNENVTLFSRMTHEGLTARHGAEVLVFARNVSDSGRKYVAVWNGDSEANFNGLAYSITSGLRSGVLVMPMWGSDTGGYLRNTNSPTEEVFARWLAFSAYCPMMEVLVGNRHTPWYHYSPALVELARKYTTLHHDLMPYTRSFLHAATQTGAPVMRPLLFTYPDDPMLVNLTDQYLYGSELLVAPVITAMATTRRVYLPAGRWLDYNGRKTVHAGGQTITAEAPLEVIPVFAREGAIIPRGDIHQGNNNWTPGWAPHLRVEVFPMQEGESRFDHYTGARVEPITARAEPGKLTITTGDLGTPGKLEVYVKAAGKVTRNGTVLAAGTDYTHDPAAGALVVSFTGPTTLVITDAVSVFAPDPPPPPAADAGAADAGAAVPDAGPMRPAGKVACACELGSEGVGGGWGVLVVLLLVVRRIRRR